jgi:hypothetical protein
MRIVSWNKNLSGDISISQERGHFYFALTHSLAAIDTRLALML